MATRDERVAGGAGGARGGVAGFARRWWRALAAELLATALLVGLGVGSALPVHGPGPAPLAHPAFAFGCMVVANAMAFGSTSGAHMNPAVTLAALAQRQLGAAAAAGYVVAQALGALLGFGALLAVVPAAAPAGCTLPGPGVSAAAAAALEAALTSVLVLACCSVWAGPADEGAPVKLGLVVTGLVFAGGDATGASLNPARSLAPALLHGVWRDHWVYWVGPLAGAALAVLVHRYVLGVPVARTPPPADIAAPASSPQPEEMPLRDKP